MVDAPDRKLDRHATEFVHDLLADGRTQVSVLLPRLLHRRRWHRLLHDSTAERLAETLSALPNVNVTFVPFHLGGDRVAVADHAVPKPVAATTVSGTPPAGTIAAVEWRTPAVVSGRIVERVIETIDGTPSLLVVVSDGTGSIGLLFLGRAHIGGMALGARLTASGMAAAHRHRLTIINPVYEFESDDEPTLSHQ